MDLIYKNEGGTILLENSIEFRNDTPFCERVYTLDLDTKMLHIANQGFNPAFAEVSFKDIRKTAHTVPVMINKIEALLESY